MIMQTKIQIIAELWYPTSFTRFIHSVAIAEGHPRLENVSEYALRRILDNAKIRSFKITYYCEKRDPNFNIKMHYVLVIYKQVSMQFDEEGKPIPFDRIPIHTLSYDEKPGMQVMELTTQDRPPIAGTDKYRFLKSFMKNMVEGFVSKLTKQMLNGIRTSVKQS